MTGNAKVKQGKPNPHVKDKKRPCPDSAALIIKGVYYPCDMMRQMHSDSKTHEGWPHTNRDAEAIWQ